MLIRQLEVIFSVLKCSDNEKRLLSLISIIPSMPVSISQAKSWFGLKNGTLIRILYEKGWLKKEEEREIYWIHSLVAESIFSQVKEELYKKSEELRKNFIDLLVYTSREEMFLNSKLVPYASSIYSKLTDDFVFFNDSKFIKALAHAYSGTNNYLQAISCYKETLMIYEANKKENTIDYANIHNSIGISFYRICEFSSAHYHFEKALNIYENNFSFQRSGSYHNIAVTYHRKSMFNDSLKWYGKAEPFFEEYYKYSLESAVYNISLSALYDSLGLFDEALNKCMTAGEIVNKCLIDDKFFSTHVQNNKAAVYCNLHDFNNAFNEIVKVVKIRSEFAKNYLIQATAYNNIAVLYYLKKDFPNAMENFENAMEIRKKIYGMEHPSTIVTYSNIGTTYLKMNNDIKKAKEVYGKLLSICKRKFGENSSSVASMYCNLAVCNNMQNDHENAGKDFSKALEIYEKAGAEHYLNKNRIVFDLYDFGKLKMNVPIIFFTKALPCHEFNL